MRFTVKDLKNYVDYFNKKFPLDEMNGYGNYNRYKVECAYSGYRVGRLIPGSTGMADCTYGYVSAREAKAKFDEYLVNHYLM